MTTLSLKQYECLNKIFSDNNVCVSHGIDHARIVMENTLNCCLAREKGSLSLEEIGNICMAGFLHDADDRKFFPNNKNYENARKVLAVPCGSLAEEHAEEKIIKMISIVSASTNKDTHDETLDESYYYPRYADRLESIGYGGIERCFKYTKTTGTLLYVPNSTKLCFTKDEIYKEMTGRYNNYSGHSNSMIDHYYDKLLHICTLPDWIHNEYLISEFEKRRDAMFEFIMYFSQVVSSSGTFTDNDVINFLSKVYKQ